MRISSNISITSLRGLAAGLLLVSPAAFLSPVRSLFLIEVGEVIIQPFATLLMIIISVLFLFYIAQLGRRRKGHKITFTVFITVAIISIINLLISRSRPATLGYLVNCFSPLLAAALLIHFDSRESYEKAIKVFSVVFVAYLLANLGAWFLVFNLRLPASSGLSYARMGGPFSEPVTLGYAIASFCPIILFQVAAFKDARLRAMGIPITVLILFVSVMATGTRGGIFLLVIYTTIWLLKKKRYDLIISLVLLTVLINPVQRFGLTVDRLKSLTDETRASTYVAGIGFWLGSELTYKLAGHGFGNVYPYNSWTQQNEYANNIFFLGPKLSIVQPHNSFIWLLVEAGIFSLAAFLLIMILLLGHVLPYMRSRNPDIDRRKASAVFFFTVFVILVNNLDAILIIFPNISFVTWYFMLGAFTFRHSLFVIPRYKGVNAVVRT